MSETTRAATPADVMRRIGAGTAAAAGAPSYDRRRWERAVMGAVDLDPNAVLVAFVLAHHGGDRGELAAGGIQTAPCLARLTNLTEKQARISLNGLERAGFTSRPDIHTWERKDVVRPLALVLPARRVPPSPGSPV